MGRNKLKIIVVPGTKSIDECNREVAHYFASLYHQNGQALKGEYAHEDNGR